MAAAIGIFLATKGNPKETVIYGANLGGDTDTIACIAGMLSGALSGLSSIDKQWKEVFTSANPSIDFSVIGEELYRIAVDFDRVCVLSEMDCCGVTSGLVKA